MMRRKHILRSVLPALVSVLLLGPVNSASATTFYVDPVNGSMAGDGSALRPWETLQGVFDNNLIETRDKGGYIKNPGAPVKAGDTLLLLSGYHGDIYESVYFNDDYITIEAAGGHTPQLKRFRLSGGKKWIIRGLTISPSFASPFERVIIVEFYSRYSGHGQCSDITVEDCLIYTIADSSGWSVTDWDTKACNGIILGMQGGPNLVARGNTLRNVNHGICAQAAGCLAEYNTIENFSGDGVRATFHDVIIQYNVIKNCYDVNDNHDDGIQSFLVNVGLGAVYRIKLIGNIIICNEDPNQPHRGTLQGIGIFGGPHFDFVVENNVVMTNHWHGITLLNSQNARIVNNTIFSKWYYGSQSNMTTWIEVSSGPTAGGNLVRNNIAHSIRTSGDSNATADHNLIVSRADNVSQWFVDYSNFDMHLVPGSPAIDAGSSQLAPVTDIEGNPRPWGPAFDIGAYEYGVGGSTISRSPSSLSPSCEEGANAPSQSFEVWNSGGGALSYNISDDAAWLSCAPTSGTSTGEHDAINVNYSTSGLQPGAYPTAITISAPGATNSPQYVSVTLSVQNAQPTAEIVNISPNPAQPPDDTIGFSGDGYDAVGTVEGWEWSSDLYGVLSTDKDFTRSSYYMAVGTHTISFRVQDNDDVWSDAVTSELTVNDALPTATMEGLPSEPVDPGSTVTVTLGGHDRDENGESITGGELSLDAEVIAAPAPGSYALQDTGPGEHAVSYRVQDDEGTWSPAVSGTIRVRPPNVSNFQATGAPQIALQWDSPEFAGFGGVLILRREGDAPQGAPADGTDYSVGDAIGDSVVAYKGTDISVADDDGGQGLTGETTYHYKALAYHTALIYSAGAETVAQTPGGPSVTEFIPGGTVANLQQVSITFDRPMDEATIAPEDISIQGPEGCPFTFLASSVEPAGDNACSIGIMCSDYDGVVRTEGAYTITIGPNIRDANRLRMKDAYTGSFSLWPFDLDANGRVDFGDLALFASDFSATAGDDNWHDGRSDFDGSNAVDQEDQNELEANFGMSPE